MEWLLSVIGNVVGGFTLLELSYLGVLLRALFVVTIFLGIFALVGMPFSKTSHFLQKEFLLTSALVCFGSIYVGEGTLMRKIKNWEFKGYELTVVAGKNNLAILVKNQCEKKETKKVDIGNGLSKFVEEKVMHTCWDQVAKVNCDSLKTDDCLVKIKDNIDKIVAADSKDTVYVFN